MATNRHGHLRHCPCSWLRSRSSTPKLDVHLQRRRRNHAAACRPNTSGRHNQRRLVELSRRHVARRAALRRRRCRWFSTRTLRSTRCSSAGVVGTRSRLVVVLGTHNTPLLVLGTRSNPRTHSSASPRGSNEAAMM